MDNQRRAYWLKTLHQWHWISSGICLIGMLLFSITGITLNHASQIEARPDVVTQRKQLPPELMRALATGAATGNKDDKKNAPLPLALRAWVDASFGLSAGERDAEWSREEIYLALPRPGGDAWVRFDRESGEVESEVTDRGWISYLNDLHKGRSTGLVWSWFIDIFAVAALLFSITGLFILKMHAAQRPITWPIVALGLVLPLLIALVFIH